MCSLEEKSQDDSQMPCYIYCVTSDMLKTHNFTVMLGPQVATSFFDVLSSKHSSLNFTMETVTDNTFPFLGMNLAKNGTILSTSVYRKPTNTGLHLHYDSHVDHRYKAGLLKAMLHRAYRLSSTWKAFTDECEILKNIFAQLRYPTKLIYSTISKVFIYDQTISNRFQCAWRKLQRGTHHNHHSV